MIGSHWRNFYFILVLFWRTACSKLCVREIKKAIVCRVDWKDAEESNWWNWSEKHYIVWDKLTRFWQFELVEYPGEWRGDGCRSVKLNISRTLHSSVPHLNLIFEAIPDWISRACSSLILEMRIQPQQHGLMAVPSTTLAASAMCWNNLQSSGHPIFSIFPMLSFWSSLSTLLGPKHISRTCMNISSKKPRVTPLDSRADYPFMWTLLNLVWKWIRLLAYWTALLFKLFPNIHCDGPY